jgi:hypothetical protein
MLSEAKDLIDKRNGWGTLQDPSGKAFRMTIIRKLSDNNNEAGFQGRTELLQLIQVSILKLVRPFYLSAHRSAHPRRCGERG